MALEVLFEEPDLVVVGNGLFIGIAAKRPKNKSRIRQRLKGAIAQLQREGGLRDQISHGVAALDVTQVGNPEGLVGVSPGIGEPSSAAQEIVDVARHHIEQRGFLEDLMRGRELRLTCGVLLFGAATQYRPDVGGVRNSQSSHVIRLRGICADYSHALDWLRGAPEHL